MIKPRKEKRKMIGCVRVTWSNYIKKKPCRTETNIEPWDRQFASIKAGANATRWPDRVPTAYWRGNPDVASPLRVALLGCNDTGLWRAEIMRQNWEEEAKSGYTHSKLSSQCTHRSVLGNY
jgi:hypothetical protein